MMDGNGIPGGVGMEASTYLGDLLGTIGSIVVLFRHLMTMIYDVERFFEKNL